MRILRPHIHLKGIQIKSIEKARKLAAAINVIEEECGIYETRVTIEDPFICPWIDTKELDGTDSERIVAKLINQVRQKRWRNVK